MFKKMCSVFIAMVMICGILPLSVSAASSVDGEDVVTYARTWVGKTPYVWGGNSLSTGTDCSGFICRVYEHFGVDLWSARGDVMKLVSSNLATNVGTNINNAKPGDIIRYSGHVALYSGNGKVIHAVSSKWNTLETSVTWFGKPIQAIIRPNPIATTTTQPSQKAKSAPAAPIGLKAERTSNTTAKISWSAVSSADNYYVEYKSPNTNNQWVKDTDYNSNGIGKSTSYSATRLGNHTYEFRVYAINSAGKSGWSNVLTYTHSKTASTTVPATAPTNLKLNNVVSRPDASGGVYAVTVNVGDTLTLTWDGVSNATKYKVEPMVWNGSEWALVGSTYTKEVGGTSVSYNNLLAGVWVFKVTAGNTAGWSSKYARWNKALIEADASTGTHTIKYNANGGSGAPSSHSAISDSNGDFTYTLSTVTPTRSGYKFLYWQLENNSAYGDYYPGQTITDNWGSGNHTITYYAFWGVSPESDPSTTTEPTVNFAKVSMYWINAVITPTVDKNGNTTRVDDFTFGLDFRVSSDQHIDEYGFILLDSNKKQIAADSQTNPKAPERRIERKEYPIHKTTFTFASTTTNVRNEGILTTLVDGNIYYYYGYVICNGYRAESSVQSFVFSTDYNKIDKSIRTGTW